MGSYDRKVMIVTWTDGTQETYKYNCSEVTEGVLHIWTEHPGSFTYKRHDDYSFPLASIRVYKSEDDF